MKRYKFLFLDYKAFSVVADSIEQAESYLSEKPIRLISIDKIPHVKIK